MMASGLDFKSASQMTNAVTQTGNFPFNSVFARRTVERRAAGAVKNADRICVTIWLLVRPMSMVASRKHEINRLYVSGISVPAKRAQANAGDL